MLYLILWTVVGLCAVLTGLAILAELYREQRESDEPDWITFYCQAWVTILIVVVGVLIAAGPW